MARFYESAVGRRQALDLVACADEVGADVRPLVRVLTEIGFLTDEGRLDQSYVDRGFGRNLELRFVRSDASLWVVFRTFVFRNGPTFFRRRWRESGGVARSNGQ